MVFEVIRSIKKKDTRKGTASTRFGWSNVYGYFQTWMTWLFFGSPVLIPIVFGLIYVPSYRGSLSSEVFTVDRRERVVSGAGENSRSYYLVWTKEGEVFCVTDTWSFMRFDSSDRYGRLRENCRVKANVAGWRIPFLSWYRNIVEIEDIQETE